MLESNGTVEVSSKDKAMAIEAKARENMMLLKAKVLIEILGLFKCKLKVYF